YMIYRENIIEINAQKDFETRWQKLKLLITLISYGTQWILVVHFLGLAAIYMLATQWPHVVKII
ncbi:hypothetical protein ACJX0J_037626, partial [Zea mays]